MSNFHHWILLLTMGFSILSVVIMVRIWAGISNLEWMIEVLRNRLSDMREKLDKR